MGFRIYVMDFTNKQAFRIDNPSAAFVRKHDNGCLISIGLYIGEDVTQATVDRWIKRGFAIAVDYDEANHGGCQSSCVRRGAAVCRW